MLKISDMMLLCNYSASNATDIQCRGVITGFFDAPCRNYWRHGRNAWL